MKTAPLSLAALLLTAIATLAQVQAPPLAAMKDTTKPGLKLTLTAGGKSDTRAARLIALFVPKGTAVSPFLPAGPFTAKWEGSILSPLRSEYTFAATVQGALKATLNGQPLFEGAGDSTAQVVNKTVQLNKGPNAIVVELAGDGKEDGQLQFTWSGKEFPPEPVPPTAFTHNIADAALRTGNRLREGRALFAQLRCAACHGDEKLIPARGTGMPELAQDAPIFAELGAKFNEAWLAQWIGDPHSIRPHSLMPRTFPVGADGAIDQRARDLAAYFVAQGKRDETAPAAENAPLGGALFANFGCIACHTAPDYQGQDEFNRVPLAHLKAKWQAPALREYLKNPSATYQSSRMPHFRLTEEEAERLTAYLLSGTQKEFAAGPAGDPVKGAQLLVSANCLNCHAGMPPTTQPTLAATLAKGWTAGCLANDAATRGQAPDFGLTAAQRDALRAFAAHGLDSLKRDVAIEHADRLMTNLRCTACHPRDGQLSAWQQLDNDIAPLTSAVPLEEGEGKPHGGTWAPMLTWLGEKLQPAWTEGFIAGTTTYKPRFWLIARMPGFSPPAAQGFAHGSSLEHGFPITSPAPAKPKEESIKAGATLLGENGGFNCTTCHHVGDKLATAIFEAPGTNLAYTHERIRKGYYDRWLLHPLRIDAESKMPRFSDDDGNTPLSEILGGKASAQFDAIWDYLGTVPKPTKAQ